MKGVSQSAQVDSIEEKCLLQSPSTTYGAPTADFNRIARCYRWLEYLTLGPILQRTRTCFLPNLSDRRHALLFGDGDGRFVARLLAQNSLITADAVDTSGAMLHLLRRRAEPSARELAGTSRLRTHNQHALTYLPTSAPDLVVTHFFLDCLTQAEVNRFISQLTPSLSPGALWLISEFRIIPGALAFSTRCIVRGLYFAFRLLTGLRVTHLPEYTTALNQAGFVRIACHHRLLGFLVAELWQRQGYATESELGYAHT